MPFLEHLDELRTRILRSCVAIWSTHNRAKRFRCTSISRWLPAACFPRRSRRELCFGSETTRGW